MPLRPLRLNTRVVLLVSCILLATGVTSGWMSARSQTASLMAAMQANASVMVRNLAQSCARFLVVQDYAQLESYLLKSAELPDIRRLQVSEPNGTLIWTVEVGADKRPWAKADIARITPPAVTSVSVEIGDDLMTIWHPVAAGTQLGWLKAEISFASIRQAQAGAWQSALLIAIAWVALSAVLIVLVLRPIVGSISRLGAFAKELDTHKGAQIAVGQQPLEIEELVRSVNEASASLQSTERQLLDERERLRKSEEKYRRIFEESFDGMFIASPAGTLLDMNRKCIAMFGYASKEEMQGLHLERDLFANPEDLKQMLADVDANGIAEDEVAVRKKTGAGLTAYCALSAVPGEDGAIASYRGIIRDITQEELAEQALHRVNRALQALSKCNEALIHASDEMQLLNDICRIIVDIEGYRLAWVGYVEHDARKTVRPVAHSGYGPGYMERADISWADDARGSGPLGIAIRTAQMQVLQDVKTDPRFARWRDNATRLGYGSVLVAPLFADAQVIGALSIHADGVNAFDEAEISLLRELAADMAFGIVTLRTRSAHERSAERLRRSMENTIQVIASTVEMRDPYTSGHQHRVTELATAIARDMGLSEDRVQGIRLAGAVHDLGKIHTPAEILNKPGKLSSIEFELIKTHCEAGYEILKDVDFPWPIAQIVYQHQERLDGSGYPRGLKGEEILLEARILMVADVVEAMASHRPYRPALSLEEAYAEIRQHAGRRYDAVVARICLGLFEQKGFAFSA